MYYVCLLVVDTFVTAAVLLFWYLLHAGVCAACQSKAKVATKDARPDVPY
jgi:hypothetical protein